MRDMQNWSDHMQWYFNLTLAEGQGNGSKTAKPDSIGDGKSDSDTKTSNTTTKDVKEGKPTQPESPGMFGMLLPFLAIILFVVILTSWGGRRERRKKEKLIAGMKKGDRVQTIGGIVGKVADIRESEIILKIDESNNTRMHFAKGAIAAVLPDGKPVDEK